jgi:GT2 family glycosyltransferase
VTELSFCIVNTGQRERLLAGLDAVAAERARLPFATEVLVLDNASEDGSAEAARADPAVDAVLALDRRRGKGENDSALLQRARGRFALLLNEDAELRPGATVALHAALAARPDAGAAGAQLLRPDGTPVPSAWRFPTPAVALAQALFLHRRLVVQSRGTAVREVDWAQSSAMLVRREAARSIGWFDPAYFVYSDEVDFCRRLRDAGWAVLWVPQARAVHHEGLTGDSVVPERRIVELARNRDRYVRRHCGPRAALVVRLLLAWAYAVRALAAAVLPGRDPARFRRHVRATLRPAEGEGLREAAATFNARRDAEEAYQPASRGPA